MFRTFCANLRKHGHLRVAYPWNRLFWGSDPFVCHPLRQNSSEAHYFWEESVPVHAVFAAQTLIFVLVTGAALSFLYLAGAVGRGLLIDDAWCWKVFLPNKFLSLLLPPLPRPRSSDEDLIDRDMYWRLRVRTDRPGSVMWRWLCTYWALQYNPMPPSRRTLHQPIQGQLK